MEVEKIVLYMLDVLLGLGLIYAVYRGILFFRGTKYGLRRGGISREGDIPKAFFGNAMEEMMLTTVAENHGYIQNNNSLIERRLKIFSPTFNADGFLGFSRDLFELVLKTGDAKKLHAVSDDADLSCLPHSIENFDFVYLHNYIVSSHTEALKVYCSVFANDSGEPAKESYFLTFKRDNPLIALKDGALTISCPSCGSEINMDEKLVSECPYCHSTVAFAESDWILSKAELINDDTKICNMAVRKINEF